ncbi:hypothetical protein [Enterococcus dispar]|nr:hypothetical protein [Enterococcus dispar]
MKNYWLVCHGDGGRKTLTFSSGEKICCDSLNGNQDPYIWGERFYTTFCKTRDLNKPVSNSGETIKPKDILIWTVPYKEEGKIVALYCDLIFEVDKIISWKKSHEWEIIDKEYRIEKCLNTIKLDGNIVQGDQKAYSEHFLVGVKDHYRKTSEDRRTIVSTKNDKHNFQPQEKKQNRLLDILGCFEESSGSRFQKENNYFKVFQLDIKEEMNIKSLLCLSDKVNQSRLRELYERTEFRTSSFKDMM